MTFTRYLTLRAKAIDDAKRIALSILERHAWDELPILADAMEEETYINTQHLTWLREGHMPVFGMEHPLLQQLEIEWMYDRYGRNVFSDQGYNAAMDGLSVDNNPYPEHSQAGADWRHGWLNYDNE